MVKPVGVIENINIPDVVNLYEIMDLELRQYLINNWLWTDCYKKDKEWFDTRWIDLKMIDRLKKYLSDNFDN